MNKEIISTAQRAQGHRALRTSDQGRRVRLRFRPNPARSKTGNLVEGGITDSNAPGDGESQRRRRSRRLFLERVVKATVFLKNIGDFAAMNEVYGEYLGQAKPARSTVAVADCRARRPGRDRPYRCCVKIAPDQIPRIIRTRLCSTSFAALPKLLATRSALSSSSPRG